jgi:hypothetical protein
VIHLFTNPNQANSDEMYNNIKTLIEDDFSNVPKDTIIWDGELPFKEGDTFPTALIQRRANLFKTNEALYSGDAYKEIFKSIFNFNDYMRDYVTNNQILRLVPSLPDYKLITDIWVALMSAKSPKIDGQDTGKISAVSTFLGVSNFAVSFQSAVRGALMMYGNAPCRVDKKEGATTKVVQMPIKTWIPFVSSSDVTTIDVNCFFSIHSREVKHDAIKGFVGPLVNTTQWFCEFMLYHEGGEDAGRIDKITYEYNKGASTLGKYVGTETTQAFDGKYKVSPIIIFTGQTVGNTVYGTPAYKKWEPSIVSAMKAYETMLILMERTKEIYRIVPSGSLQRDEHTGQTISAQTGTIAYEVNEDGTGAPDVKLVIPLVPLEVAIKVLQEATVRVARDTGIAYTMFDTKELGSNMSGKALKTAMFGTELQAKSLMTLMINSAKSLVTKIALAEGLELDSGDFTLTAESGFVNDTETLTTLVQQRNGNLPSLSLEDSIALLDDVNRAEAISRARELRGEEEIEIVPVSNTDAGDVSQVVDLQFSAGSTGLDTGSVTPSTRGSAPNVFYPLGGENI